MPPVGLTVATRPLTCEPCWTTARTWSPSVVPWSTGPHADLSGLRAGYHHQVPNLTSRVRVRVAALTLITEEDSVRAVLCRRRLERILAIDAETAELKRQIADLVAAAGTTLTDLHGIGPLVAARFIAEIVDVRRYPNRNAFAAANGTAPTARLLRADRPAPVQSRREPATQPRALHHRDHPNPRRHRRPGLLRTQTSRRQNQTRIPALPQTAAVRHRVHHHARRRRPANATARAATPPNPARVGATDANEARLTA
jgi:hypothetical protein